MNHAMIAALKKRKSGGDGMMGDHQDMGHPSQHAAEGDKDLPGFVASLSEHEKHSLKQMLDKNPSSALNIAKGEPSKEEQAKIEQQSAKDMNEEMQELEAMPAKGSVPENESDEIGKSMLDSRHMRGMAVNDKPRNLGERVKQSIAAKLKAKGKI